MTKRFEKFLVPMLFGIYLLIGILIHSDYGVSWDEPISRTNGLVNLKYLESKFAPSLLTDEVRNQQDLDSYTDKDYGVAFELPLVMLEQAFGVSEDNLYSFRHLVIFLFSSLGVLAIYKTAKFVYGDYKLGLLAALMIILSPRMFAESFYNSKDIVFMAGMAMAMYTLTRLITTPRIGLAILHGTVSAIAIDIRIMGILIVAATIGVLVVRAIKEEVPLRHTLACLLAYLAATALVVVALFPYLWHDPIGHFMAAFSNMARFRWDGWVLYMGTTYLASGLPWHYIPVWMLITTPLLFSAMMVAGVVHSARTLFRSRFSLWRTDRQMAELTFLALLFFPVLAIIAIHALVYDGWRHMYFVYPAFVLVAIGGFVALKDLVRNAPLLKAAGLGLLTIGFCANAYWIVHSHPLQNVYFNPVAGRNWKDQFEVDYWGVGNWGVLKSLLDRNDGRPIAIKADSATPLDRALLSMPRKDRDRFVLTPQEAKPEFVLTNYRGAKYCQGLCDISDYDLYSQKFVDGELVVSVFRIRDLALADQITMIDRPYSVEEFRHLSAHVARRYKRGEQTYVDLKIVNDGPQPMAATSSVGKPIRISWRFVDAHGASAEGWNTRQELPRDVPAQGELKVTISIDARKETAGGFLEFGLLQEGVFWGHDAGLVDATLPSAIPVGDPKQDVQGEVAGLPAGG